MKTLILLMPFIFSLLYVALLFKIIGTVMSPGKLKNAGCIKNTSDSNFNQLITDFTAFEEKKQQTDALKK